MPYFNYTST